MKRKRLITSNTLALQEVFTELKYTNTHHSEYNKGG